MAIILFVRFQRDCYCIRASIPFIFARDNESVINCTSMVEQRLRVLLPLSVYDPDMCFAYTLPVYGLWYANRVRACGTYT